MRTYYRILNICIVLFGVILFPACKKYIPGPKGEQGPPGKNGNIKLLSITALPKNWTSIHKGWTSHSIINQITDRVLSEGEVEVYMKISEQWWKLPHAAGNLITQVRIEKGFIHYNHAKIHDEVPPVPQDATFKIVISEPVD